MPSVLCFRLLELNVNAFSLSLGLHFNWSMKVKLGEKKALVDVLRQAGILERQEATGCCSRNRPWPARPPERKVKVLSTELTSRTLSVEIELFPHHDHTVICFLVVGAVVSRMT